MLLTHNLVATAKLLMYDPDRDHWVWGIKAQTGMPPGSAHLIVQKFRREGWITDAPSPSGEFPSRRYFRLTDTGRDALADILRRAATDPRFTHHNLPRSTQ